jgi:hypothetical protein
MSGCRGIEFAGYLYRFPLPDRLGAPTQSMGSPLAVRHLRTTRFPGAHSGSAGRCRHEPKSVSLGPPARPYPEFHRAGVKVASSVLLGSI